jgi:subtilase family serine protease
MLSAAMLPATVHTNRIYFSTAAESASDIQGYTPDEIRTGYGFNTAAFTGSSATPDGTGQTIAIVDAYNDPHVAADLAVFDSQFDLPAANLKVVNQTGGSDLPKTDPGWAGEIALDVEWAHAIAPGADILLVETETENTSDLMAGVDFARSVAGVSVISLSWGGGETTGYAGDSGSQLSMDAQLTTPSGHKGITFVAAAGDSGSGAGVEWPASSPNVLSVGGTSLTLNSDGSYVSEVGWPDTSGGYSQVESEPSYQDAVQSTGQRSTPDVAYLADSNNGVAVYDSVPDAGVSGWQDVGGTSAGAPQWAALIAIADQGRVIAGHNTLNGATQTLPDLYSLYGNPGTKAYSVYTTYFNDVEYYTHRDRLTGLGYDTETGLGSPHAANVIAALDGDNVNGGGTTTPAISTTSPVSISFVTQPVSSVVGGATGSVKVAVTDVSGTPFLGPVTVTLYSSSGGSISASSNLLATVTVKSLSLPANGSKIFKLNFTYPSTLSTGNYDIIASAQASATDDVAGTALSASPVTIAAPVVDLATAFASQSAIAVHPGKSTTVAITITNTGNVTAAGTLALLLYASASGVIDANAVQLASEPKVKIKIAAGKHLTLHVRFKAPSSLDAGAYSLIASITPTTTPSDANASNNIAVIATQ